MIQLSPTAHLLASFNLSETNNPLLVCNCLGGGSGEESDVLSINADADDSDIEGPKEEKAQEAEDEKEDAVSPTTQPAQEEPEEGKPRGKEQKQKEEKEDAPRLELQQDIERSVSEILALSVPHEPPPPQPRAAQPVQARPQRTQQRSAVVPSAPATSVAVVAVAQPSAQQLELLELEMRARAIKALMKANDASKQAPGP